jgi:hypothetical protein
MIALRVLFVGLDSVLSRFCILRPALSPCDASFTPASAPLFEVLKNLLLGDSFGSEGGLQARGCFFECRTIHFGALMARWNVVETAAFSPPTDLQLSPARVKNH